MEQVRYLQNLKITFTSSLQSEVFRSHKTIKPHNYPISQKENSIQKRYTYKITFFVFINAISNLDIP